MAAEIFSEVFIIFNGLSSSKTSFNASSKGGLYLNSSSIFEKIKFLLWSIICISSISLINFWVFRNLRYASEFSLRNLVKITAIVFLPKRFVLRFIDNV